jgi:hypothetical protein
MFLKGFCQFVFLLCLSFFCVCVVFFVSDVFCNYVFTDHMCCITADHSIVWEEAAGRNTAVAGSIAVAGGIAAVEGIAADLGMAERKLAGSGECQDSVIRNAFYIK